MFLFLSAMKGFDFTFATMNNLLQHRDKLPFNDKCFGRSLCCKYQVHLEMAVGLSVQMKLPVSKFNLK